MTLPPATTIADLDGVIRQMLPRLLSRRPREAMYELGREMAFELFSVRVTGVKGYGRRCSLHQTGRMRFEIRIDGQADPGTPDVEALISRMMKKLAAYVAKDVLIGQAEMVAARIGVSPAEWCLSSGRRTLGRCSSRKEIALSVVLVFLPEKLREYVICHELAHLSEMNHSPRFHALCDRYCNGCERELAAELKAFVIPVV